MELLEVKKVLQDASEKLGLKIESMKEAVMKYQYICLLEISQPGKLKEQVFAAYVED